MIDKVSHVSCLKNFPGECVCTFCFDPVFTFSLVMLHWLLCYVLSRLEMEADISIVSFHIIWMNGIYIFSYPKNKNHFRCAEYLTLSTFDTNAILIYGPQLQYFWCEKILLIYSMYRADEASFLYNSLSSQYFGPVDVEYLLHILGQKSNTIKSCCWYNLLPLNNMNIHFQKWI